MDTPLRILLPDAQYWIRVYCPVCQRLMQGMRLRSFVRKRTGTPAVDYRCVCPDCQYWVSMVIPRELARQYTDHPELVGA